MCRSLFFFLLSFIPGFWGNCSLIVLFCWPGSTQIHSPSGQKLKSSFVSFAKPRITETVIVPLFKNPFSRTKRQNGQKIVAVISKCLIKGHLFAKYTNLYWCDWTTPGSTQCLVSMGLKELRSHVSTRRDSYWSRTVMEGGIPLGSAHPVSRSCCSCM